MSLAGRFSALALLALLAAPAGGVEVAGLARPAGGLLDRTGRVGRESTAEFRRIAEHVRRETGGEIAGLVLDSLEGKEPGAFARELSEAWRLGGDEAKGMLILVAMKDRTVDLSLGRGLDDPARRARAAEIVRDVLAPRLREGDVGAALAAAAREGATRIFYAVEVVEPAEGEGAPPPPPGKPAEPAPAEAAAPADRSFEWVPWAIGLAVLLLGLAIFGALRSEKS